MLNDTTRQFKQQLPRNMFLQVLSFLTQVGVGICLVPYLVHHLGRAAYGLIPIAGALTQYVALINHSISSAVTRFLTIAFQQDDHEDANRIFNTAFFSYLALGLIQIPVFALLIWNANMLFSIPQELYRDTIILLTCSAAAFLINLISSVFAVPQYANNRLDISRSIDITRQILRLTGIVILFLNFGPRLRYVGYVDLTLSVFIAIINIYIARRLAPMLLLRLGSFDYSKIRQLMSMGGWLLVNQVGVLLFMRTDVWVCNRFVSAEAAGDYAAILQWSSLIRSGAAILAGVVAPMITIYYARKEIENLVRLSKLSVRLFSIVLAIPISILCVFSPQILRLWLGDSFIRLSPLMVIMLCHLGINISVSPLLYAKTALNRVRWPGLVTLFAGILNIFLAIILVKHSNWGIYGVAIAGAIILTLKNALFMPIYGALILKQPWTSFITPYLSGLMLLSALVVLGFVINRWIQPTCWSRLVLVIFLMGSTATGLGWLLLPRQDRHTIVTLIPSRLRILAGTG